PALHGGGLRRAGGALLAAGGPTGQRPLGLSGGRQPPDHRYRAAPDPARDAGAYPACFNPAHRPRRGTARDQRTCGARVEHAYTQARALCQQVGETPELVPVLFGLWRFYVTRPQLHTARELGETLLRLAQRAHDPALAVIAHYALGATWFYLAALPAARQHPEAR